MLLLYLSVVDTTLRRGVFIFITVIGLLCYGCFPMSFAEGYYAEYNLPYPAKIVDSACIVFSYTNTEFKIADSIFEHSISTSNDQTSKNKMQNYLDTRVYYPFSPTIMNSYYICKSANFNYYYFYTVANRGDFSILLLDWVKTDSLRSKAIYRESLKKPERNLIKNDFMTTVVPQIETISKRIAKQQ